MGSGESKQNIRKFLLGLLMFAAVCIIHYYEGRMNAQNTTAYAMTYEFGWIPRGFIGSLIALAADVTGLPLQTYRGSIGISWCATGIWFLALFWFYREILVRVREEQLHHTEALIAFTSIFFFPEFLTWNNFGRLDEYLWIITILCLIILLRGRAIWLVIPLCAIAGMIHIGFVFTNIAIILVALILGAMRREGRERRYWSVILILTFLAVSAEFLYLEIFRQPLDQAAYQQIVARAQYMAEDGRSYSRELLYSEVLGKNVYGYEWTWHKRNFFEFPLFLVFFSPYLRILIGYFRRLFAEAGARREQNTSPLRQLLWWKYLVCLGGIMTLLPELILKVDFGRWMFCLIGYYCLVVLWLLAEQDTAAEKACRDECCEIRKRCPLWPLLFLYALVFMPFRDVYISDVTTNLMNPIAWRLGFWQRGK